MFLHPYQLFLRMIVKNGENDTNIHTLMSCEDCHQATNILWRIKVHIFHKRLLVAHILTFNYI